MIINDTIPFLENEYRLYTDKWNRAICGNSFGGVAAGLMGWSHPELFGNIGFFAAPVRYENIWKKYEENTHMHWMVENGDKVGEQYKVLFFSRGEAEYLTNKIFRWMMTGFPVMESFGRTVHICVYTLKISHMIIPLFALASQISANSCLKMKSAI